MTTEEQEPTSKQPAAPTTGDDRLEAMSAELESAAVALQKIVDQMRQTLGNT